MAAGDGRSLQVVDDGRPLLARSHLREPCAQDRRQAGLDLRRDQAGLVEVHQVGFILRPEAGKLHANQIRQRNQTDAMEHPNRAR